MAEHAFGILLTGGSSTRMGRDKATIALGDTTLARRSAGALEAVTSAALEVGSGVSGLPHVEEDPLGSGPLAAVVAAWHALVARQTRRRPAVVVACDLPHLSSTLLGWLAAQPGDASVVPLLDGVPQPLCARWSVADLDRAVAQLASGERSLRRVFGPDARYVPEPDWQQVAPRRALYDVDTQEDLARLGLAAPELGDEWIALGEHPLPARAAAQWATLPGCGAVVTFEGTVRDHSEGRAGVDTLDYEAYETPALTRMGEVVAEARKRWPDLVRVALLHRVGRLLVGETSVLVVASSAHRAVAFRAGEFVIDTVKETVPIWKLEHWRDGEAWGSDAHPVRSL